MKSTVTINKDDNLLSLKVSRSNKPCKKHHYFLDIDNAYDKFYENLKIDNDFYNKWYRPLQQSPFEKGVKSNSDQLRAFFDWYVSTGGEPVPF